jgi:ATP-dependent DNA helicase RecG
MAKKTSETFNPEKYMQLAIDAMKDSIEEPRTDGKVSPKVGAVLIKPDGTVESASRGELRLGDHAEFTLLERKNRSEKLDGSILFATLEPCAPGARRHPKLGCAERIVNARIKEVWIGIEDPDPDVDRKGIKFLEDNGIKVNLFYPEFQKVIKEINKEFLKQATGRANDRKEKKEVVLSNLENAIPTMDVKQFSEKAIQYYLEQSKLPHTIGSNELWLHFEHAGIVQRVKTTNKEKYIPTGFGILLFGVNPREKYQQAVVKAKVKYGNNASIPKDFEGPLVLIPKEIELWLEQVLHSEVSRKQFQRKTNTIFPIEPLREAIINALVHRDYEQEGAKTYIEIDDDKIVVKSAGLPVSPVSLDEVKAFRAPSLSRNPKITYVFNRMGLMEESELGMETFRGMQEKYKLPLPFYEFKAPYLTLTFPRSIEATKALSGNESLGDLNNEEILGLNWIKTQRQVSTSNYASHFGFTHKKAQRQLAKLVEKGLLFLEGRGRAAVYRTKDKDE